MIRRCGNFCGMLKKIMKPFQKTFYEMISQILVTFQVNNKKMEKYK